MFLVKKIIIPLLAVGLIISLWFNYKYYQQQKNIQALKSYTYNQFVTSVVDAGRALGYQSNAHNKKIASVRIGEGAMALKQWSIYCRTSSTKSAPHIDEIANYLSYVALILVDPTNEFKGDDVSGEKYVKKITKLFFEKLSENGALNDITNKNEDEIFNKLYHLIPNTKLKEPQGHIDVDFF